MQWTKSIVRHFHPTANKWNQEETDIFTWCNIKTNTLANVLVWYSHSIRIDMMWLLSYFSTTIYPHTVSNINFIIAIQTCVKPWFYKKKWIVQQQVKLLVNEMCYTIHHRSTKSVSPQKSVSPHTSHIMGFINTALDESKGVNILFA